MSDTWRNKWRLILSSVLMMAASHAFGQEIPEHYVPVGPTAMGNAHTAIANDENSIWTNPAGISRVRKARSRAPIHLFKAPTFVFGANANSRTFAEAFQSSSSKSVQEIVTKTTALGDKPFWTRGGIILPQVMFDIERGTPVSIALYTNTKAKAFIDKDNPEEAQIEAVGDTGGVFSYAFTDRSNRFNFGIQLRPMYRYAYEEQIPSEELLDKTGMKQRIENGANRAQGIGVDVGMLYTVPDFWFPTIGFSIFNLPTGCKSGYLNPFSEERETVCGNVFRGSFGNEDALSTVDPMDFRVGMSITPRLGRKTALRFGLDLHHLPISDGTNSYGLTGIEFQKLVHGGMELFFGNPLLIPPFALRAGYSQGFISLGGRLNLSFLTLEFASYGQDISPSATPIEDRRYLLTVGVDY